MNMRFEPAGPLSGELTAPADKSISHRAALLGAMASYPVRIENYLHAADTDSTLNAVRALGRLWRCARARWYPRRGAARGARAGRADRRRQCGHAAAVAGWLAAQGGRTFTLTGTSRSAGVRRPRGRAVGADGRRAVQATDGRRR
jgi:3-phosphoshikimate 1-carboxyvinyltransferase